MFYKHYWVNGGTIILYNNILEIFSINLTLFGGITNIYKNIFITIDLDVLDPSVMSGVGTPEAGGLTYMELIGWLKYLKNFNIIGMDIVELAPDIDTSKNSTALACKLIRECLMLL